MRISGWWLLRAAGSVAAAAILLAIVPVDVVWMAIKRVPPLVWLASVGVFVCGHGLNALKFWLLLRADAAPPSACLRAHFAGMAANLGLPGVAGGEIVRVAFLAPTAGTARVALAAVADRLVDTVVLIVVVVVAAGVAGVPAQWSAAPTMTATRWAVVAAVCLALALAWRAVRRRPSGVAVRDAAAGLARRPRALIGALAIAAGVQCAFVLTNAWLGANLGLQVGISAWFLAWTASKLSAILPISLGGLGVREAALVSVLAAYGAPAEIVLATGILWEGVIVAGSLGGFLVLELLPR